MITDSNTIRFGLLAIAYLIGTISPSFLIGKYVYGIDIRKEGEFIMLVISYDQTDKWTQKPNKEGSLFLFKSDIERYGGELNHYLDRTTKMYIINIKMKCYE